jgi:hypothetical protein
MTGIYCKSAVVFILCMGFLSGEWAHCQDVEPRRWTPLPSGTSIVGTGYVKTSGNIALDPLLLLEDGKTEIDSLVFSYSRFFTLGERLARFDAVIPVHHATWVGLLDGTPAQVTREGIADPVFRLSINLLGAPVAGASQSPQGKTTRRVNTVVGAAIAVSVPVGDYLDDKLLNLGQNRYVIRPQIGVVHTRGPWSYELTGSTFFTTDNNSFFNGKKREQDPVFAVQSHLIRVFQPGLWASLSGAYAWGGENTVDSVAKGDSRRGFLAAASVGFPVAHNQSVKFAYVASRKNADTGSDLDTLAIGWSMRF